MQSLRLRALALLSAISLNQPAAMAAFPRRLIDEPIFGLYFAPDKARFDTLRLADLPEPCRGPVLRDFVPEARFLVYGDRITASSRMLVLGAKGAGLFLLIRPEHCEVAGAFLTLLQRRHTPTKPYDAPVLSPSDLHDIFADVLIRYAKAFGGKQQFFRWLDALTPLTRRGCVGKPDTYCPPTYHTLPIELQDMLKAYRPD